ncbi:DUF1996 domain-containing protein [Streptomyces sp. 12297]|uniref:DUF1996 domain-containing protein n=1 Tax=Streptomyces sp. NBC_00239 TaxID=2903640 RepID=UPI002E2BEF03|nr:DUF1996 domain-containing protein [Streptomyces sp. NBC_00239]
MARRDRGRTPLLLFLVCAALGGLLASALLGAARSATPDPADAAAGELVDVRSLPDEPPGPDRTGPDASTGTVDLDCGRNEEGHYNQDNLVVSPGLRHGAHHTHAYVGNLSTDAGSTDASLAAADTTCVGGDRSTYYWPVLRRPDRPARAAFERAAGHGNSGEVLRPAAVSLRFDGNPVGKVVAMPRFLRAMTGNAVAHTQGDDTDVRARWGCAGFPGRATTGYPRCPAGDRLTRTLVFPSCWNGLDTQSPGHRAHLSFPDAAGVCPGGFFAVPRLTLRLAYDVPYGAPVALDSFPEQRHSPRTDHAMFVNVMTDGQMARVVDCLNRGRAC